MSKRTSEETKHAIYQYWLETGDSNIAIGNRFKVSGTTVCKIINERTKPVTTHKRKSTPMESDIITEDIYPYRFINQCIGSDSWDNTVKINVRL